MLNINCKHDCSDEDCYKCVKHGIVLRCPPDCEDFEDAVSDLPENLKEQREIFMKKLKENKNA